MKFFGASTVVPRTSDEILVAIQITIWTWWRFVITLPFIIVVTCPDLGAGNDPKALGLVHSPLEGLKQSTVWLWRRFALSECFVL